MNKPEKSKIKKTLRRYNYWRRTLELSFRPRRKPIAGAGCQVACHSDPCSADPTCSDDSD